MNLNFATVTEYYDGKPFAKKLELLYELTKKQEYYRASCADFKLSINS